MTLPSRAAVAQYMPLAEKEITDTSATWWPLSSKACLKSSRRRTTTPLLSLPGTARNDPSAPRQAQRLRPPSGVPSSSSSMTGAMRRSVWRSPPDCTSQICSVPSVPTLASSSPLGSYAKLATGVSAALNTRKTL